MRYKQLIWLAACPALASIAVAPASAQVSTPNPNALPTPAADTSDRGDEGLFGDGRVKPAKKRKFTVNGRAAFEVQTLQNADLDKDGDGDRTAVAPEVRLDFTYLPKKRMEVFVSLEVGDDLVRREGDWHNRARLELREAYILIDHSIARDVEFQFGRQRFKDHRQWLYDERLDGVRLAYDHQAWRVEVAYAREELVRKDLFRRNRSRDMVDNFLFRAEYELTPGWDIAAYVLKQNDIRSSNVSPLFLGIQSSGRITPRVGHWLELSMQRGEVGARKLRANAVDAGLIYTLPMRFRPAIFAGYARGSGGGNERTSHEFRQTGLQDNEDRITGLGNVHYYGELLDPDLSNLRILTLGVGLRPSSSASVEFVGHKYRQVHLSDDDIRGSPISPELDGDSRRIGTEIDAVAAKRFGNGVGLELKLGWFRPGSGFSDTDRHDAYYGKIRLVKQF